MRQSAREWRPARHHDRRQSVIGGAERGEDAVALGRLPRCPVCGPLSSTRPAGITVSGRLGRIGLGVDLQPEAGRPVVSFEEQLPASGCLEREAGAPFVAWTHIVAAHMGLWAPIERALITCV